MSPKKPASGKSAARKSSPKGARKSAPKSRTESPMRKTERAIGSNPDGMAHQAQAAHQPPPPEVPARTPARTQPATPAAQAPMNTPPATTSSTPAPDQGQEK